LILCLLDSILHEALIAAGDITREIHEAAQENIMSCELKGVV
jgi:hypothetical protein